MKYGLSLRICQPLYTRYCRFSIKVDEVKSSYQDIRANVDANFCGNFQHAACLVKEVDKYINFDAKRIKIVVLIKAVPKW